MGRFLLDTTVLIDLSKGVPGVGGRLAAMADAGDELGICAVNVAEFFAGVPPDRRPFWTRRLASFAYWEITWEAAVLAGAYRQAFARRGRAIHTPDAILAGLARALGATIVTDNAKDYLMTDVKVLTLRP